MIAASANATPIVPGGIPCNAQLEQQLLGAILSDPGVFPHVAYLEPHDFYEPLHQKIYEVALGLHKDGKIVTITMLKPHLPLNLQITPGFTVNTYLARLAAEAVTTRYAPHYARELREMAQRRLGFSWG